MTCAELFFCVGLLALCGVFGQRCACGAKPIPKLEGVTERTRYFCSEMCAKNGPKRTAEEDAEWCATVAKIEERIDDDRQKRQDRKYTRHKWKEIVADYGATNDALWRLTPDPDPRTRTDILWIASATQLRCDTVRPENITDDELATAPEVDYDQQFADREKYKAVKDGLCARCGLVHPEPFDVDCPLFRILVKFGQDIVEGIDLAVKQADRRGKRGRPPKYANDAARQRADHARKGINGHRPSTEEQLWMTVKTDTRFHPNRGAYLTDAPKGCGRTWQILENKDADTETA